MYKIGLEIHVQLNILKKLFTSSNSSSLFNQNESISLFDIAVPGTFAHINKDAITKAIRAAKLFNCKVAKYVKFDRKHYHYPDLPSGYQITQFEDPIGQGGCYELQNNTITLDNIHIECDAGKTKNYGKKVSVDYNRCGIALVEIVTNPDFNSFEEVEEFLKLLISDLRINDISRANMDEGNLRVDVNISRIISNNQTTCRFEIKNLNSIKSIKSAIKLAKEDLIDKSEKDKSMTLFYDEAKNTLIEGREKEGYLGYMYMMEPSLYPVSTEIYEENVNIEKTIEKIIKMNLIMPNVDKNIILQLGCSKRLYNIYIKIIESLKIENYRAIVAILMDLNTYFEDETNDKIIEFYSNQLIKGLELLQNKRVLKITLVESLKKIFDEKINDEIEEYLSKEDSLIKEACDSNTLEEILLIINSSDELKEVFERAKAKDEKAISFLIGQIRKVSKNIHPNKIKEIIGI